MKACVGSKILHSKKQEVRASTKVMTAVVQSPLIYLGDFRMVMQINTSLFLTFTVATEAYARFQFAIVSCILI